MFFLGSGLKLIWGRYYEKNHLEDVSQKSNISIQNSDMEKGMDARTLSAEILRYAEILRLW